MVGLIGCRAELDSQDNTTKWNWVQRTREVRQHQGLGGGFGHSKESQQQKMEAFLAAKHLQESLELSPGEATKNVVNARTKIRAGSSGWVAQFCIAQGPQLLIQLAQSGLVTVRSINSMALPRTASGNIAADPAEILVEETLICLKYLINNEIAANQLFKDDQLVQLLVAVASGYDDLGDVCFQLLFAATIYRKDEREQKGLDLVRRVIHAHEGGYDLFVHVMMRAAGSDDDSGYGEDEDDVEEDESDNELDTETLKVGMLLFNAMANNLREAADRVMVRTELFHSGMHEFISKLKKLIPEEGEPGSRSALRPGESLSEFDLDMEVLKSLVEDWDDGVEKDEYQMLADTPANRVVTRLSELVDNMTDALHGKAEMTSFSNLLNYFAKIQDDENGESMWQIVEHVVYQLVCRHTLPADLCEFKLRATNRSVMEGLTEASESLVSQLELSGDDAARQSDRIKQLEEALAATGAEVPEERGLNHTAKQRYEKAAAEAEAARVSSEGAAEAAVLAPEGLVEGAVGKDRILEELHAEKTVGRPHAARIA